MTRNHLTEAQRASAPLFLGEHGGWGYGMAAPGPTRAGPPEPSGYGWNGGTGTLWTTDPDYGLTGIVLSTRAMTSPGRPRTWWTSGRRPTGRWPAERGGSGRPGVR